MDAAALFIVLNTDPVVIDTNAISLRGGITPIIMPFDGLPIATRAQLLIKHDQLPLDLRVATALEAGNVNAAWELVIRSPGPSHRTAALQFVLNAWATKEAARLKLPAARENIQLISSNEQIRRAIDVATAFGSVRDMLSALTWPRWGGAFVVIIGDVGEADPFPGIEQKIRPALPMMRMPEQIKGVTQSEQLCVLLTQLTLSLEAPPTNGWPPWLSTGLQAVAKAKMRGEGPSPLKMLGLRQEAGLMKLQELLTDQNPSEELAMALCAPLVHTRRRHLLANLLDLIRGGAESEGAIRVAYGLTLTQLLQER